jgi:hypothetical protein
MRWRAPPFLVFAACSTPGSPPLDPADGATSAQPVAAASVEAMTTPGANAATTSVEPSGEITNSPPASGVVMDNATPPGSGTVVTRLQPIIDVITQNTDKYRACFDGWGHSNPGGEIKVMLSIQLDKEGGLTSAALKPDESDVVDKQMEACIATISKSLKFPVSPGGQGTRYNHRFVFKAKKS